MDNQPYAGTKSINFREYTAQTHPYGECEQNPTAYQDQPTISGNLHQANQGPKSYPLAESESHPASDPPPGILCSTPSKYNLHEYHTTPDAQVDPQAVRQRDNKRLGYEITWLVINQGWSKQQQP